jgi:hypothetical protein
MNSTFPRQAQSSRTTASNDDASGTSAFPPPPTTPAPSPPSRTTASNSPPPPTDAPPPLPPGTATNRTDAEQERKDQTNVRDDVFALLKSVPAGSTETEVEEEFEDQVANGRDDMLAGQQLGNEAEDLLEDSAPQIGEIVGQESLKIVALLKEPAIDDALQAVLLRNRLLEENGVDDIAHLPEGAKKELMDFCEIERNPNSAFDMDGEIEDALVKIVYAGKEALASNLKNGTSAGEIQIAEVNTVLGLDTVDTSNAENLGDLSGAIKRNRIRSN